MKYTSHVICLARGIAEETSSPQIHPDPPPPWELKWNWQNRNFLMKRQEYSSSWSLWFFLGIREVGKDHFNKFLWLWNGLCVLKMWKISSNSATCFLCSMCPLHVTALLWVNGFMLMGRKKGLLMRFQCPNRYAKANPQAALNGFWRAPKEFNLKVRKKNGDRIHSIEKNTSHTYNLNPTLIH